jgi:molecular chaperone DnaK
MKDILCGIDLGTTNSTIAYLREGRPIPLPVDEDSALVPSVVSLDEAGAQILVGRQARNRLAAFPEHTVRSVKRLMGKETRISLGEKSFSPEEISSFILRYLSRRAGEILGQPIQKTVITVPAYFNDAQRRATIRAGELVGLEVIRIINEPTSASLVYDCASFLEEEKSPYLMVYDLGGGTFDVSILEIKGEIKEVLASCGDTALGGDDFDERLLNHFFRHLKEKTGGDFSEPSRALHVRMKDIAEKTKISLSDTPYVPVREVAVASLNGEVVNLELEVSRREYEEMIADLVEKTVQKTEEALREAHLSPPDIGKIILVGGATRTPLVQRRLAEVFDRPVDHSIDPDLCVALGAAVQSGLIAGEPLGHILLDVTAHSLGVKTLDQIDPETGDADYFSPIIRRNTKIPARKTEAYYTVIENQTGVEVEVYQGESPSCTENTPVGHFRFPLKPAPAHSPVTVEFAYDKEGVVHVTVDQKGKENRKEMTLNVRRKQVADKSREQEQPEILNYVLQKSRRLMQEESLPAELREELAALSRDYERALRNREADEKIDDLEDRLLAKMEEADERLVDD